MFKNVASQKLIVFAFDTTTSAAKTGDAANLTAYVSKDYGSVTVLGDTSATEMDSTNAKGYYLFDLTQAETNGDTLLFSAKSSTSNISVIGVPGTVFTLPPNFSTAVISAGGVISANLAQILGTALTETSGQIAAAFKKFFDKATPTGTINSIPDAVAGATGGLFIAGTNAATTITTALTTTFTGSLTGSVASVTAGVTLAASAVQAIWDALTSALTTVGSIGKLLVDNVNATISSRLASASYTAPLDAAGTRSAVGLASANLDTQITGIPAAVNTATLTEGYPAQGAALTPTKALYSIHQMLAEKAISGTTLTTKKRDGSTTAKTFTLDSATAPTSIAETT